MRRSPDLSQSEFPQFESRGLLSARFLGRYWHWPVLVLVLCAAYAGVCIFLGQLRATYVVNGTSTPYEVRIGIHAIRLPAGGVHKVVLGEGARTLTYLSGPRAGESITLDLSTPFLTRPFNRAFFVVNPDRTAVIEWEQIPYYIEGRMPSGEDPNYKYKYHVGKRIYQFRGIDFVFKPAPDELSTESSARVVMRERVSVADYLEPYDVLDILAQNKTEQEMADFLEEALRYEVSQAQYLDAYLWTLPPEEALEYLKPLLERRPALVECHLAYLDQIGRLNDPPDLRNRYRELVDENEDDPALLYLLGILTSDPAEADKLLEHASSLPDAPPHPHHALYLRYLARARFEDALRHADSLLQYPDDRAVALSAKVDALQALGRFEEALNACRTWQANEPTDIYPVIKELSLRHSLQPSHGTEEQVISQFLSRIRKDGCSHDEVNDCMLHLRAHVAYLSDQFAPAASILAAAAGYYPQFTMHVLRGELEDAEKVLDESEYSDYDDYLALAVAARLTDREDLAGRTIERAAQLLEMWDEDYAPLASQLTGRAPVDLAALRELPLQPPIKAKALALLGLNHPQYRKTCFDLAGRLNFERYFPSHLVENVINDRL